jgi:hypothetical protein
MNTQYYNNQISEARMKLDAITQKAEQEYKNTVTEQVHNFIDDVKKYWPQGLRLSSYRTHSSHYLHIYNDDGKRVHRTFIAISNGYQYKPKQTYKLQDDNLEALHYFGRCIKDMGEAISKFEQHPGGPMFEYGGWHFKGTHTKHDLGLDVVPDYVIKEMVKFGCAPQYWNVAGLGYDCGDELRKEWDCKAFRKASGKDYDVYYCMEDGHYYFPSKERLANIYMDNLEKNIRYLIKDHEERAA